MKFNSQKLILKFAKFIQIVCRVFGLKATYFFANLIYTIARFTKIKKDIEGNIEKVFPGRYSKEQKDSLANDLLKSISYTLFEIISLPLLKEEQLDSIIEVEGVDHLESALSQKKGALILSLHTSNSESVQMGLRNLGYPTNMIVRNPIGDKLFEFLKECQESKGTKLINVEQTNIFQESLKLLERGEIIGIAVDTGALEGKHIFLDFLGHKVPLAVGWKILAQRRNTPVIPVLTMRDNQKNRVVFNKPLIIPRDKEGEIAAIKQILNIFEKYVEEDPSRWNMFLSSYETERMLKTNVK